MNYEAFWKALLDYGVLETSELKTWMRHMESVWRIHGCFPEMDKVRLCHRTMNETKCVKRDTWIPVSSCDCNEFMMGWYHSTIRSRAMEQYELEYWREATEPFSHLSGEKANA